MNTFETTGKGISDIVGVFTDPILVFPLVWGDTLPEWLKNTITMERLEMNMRALKGEEMTGTDAEACAYLYTAGFTAPMVHDWSQIYLYIAGKTYARYKGNQAPDDIQVESLNDYQLRELNRLKSWLYRKKTRVRQEGERIERRQAREEAKVRREAEQPALFKL